MCGICGAFHRHGPPPERGDVGRVNERIRHRGPDDGGIWTGGPAALAMRRLSILDIEGGAQPMADPEGRRVLVYNGEIYNFQDLRSDLEDAGWAFRTRSDTEVVLAALSIWGREALARFNGMFALALWDTVGESLLLARDPVGIKPLYYELRPDRLVWASELQALRAWPGISSEVDPAALARYLVLEYVPTPRAMIQGVRKLEPGAWLEVSADAERRGSFRESPFRHPGPEARASDADKEARFLEILGGAVRRQMVADVPVGVFLSGGIDSSALAAAAVKWTGGTVRTFSVGFREASFDETRWARTVARHLGTEHTEEILDTDAALALVPELARIMDEPLGDGSLLPTTLLCRFTREHVKVALSGDGGDELFAGYPTFQAHRAARLYRMSGPLGPGLVAPAARLLPVSHRNFSFDFKVKRFVRGAHLPNPDRHVLWMGSFDPARLDRILRPEPLEAAGDPWEEIRERWDETGGGPDWDRARRFDFLTYLRDDLLAKTDRASMAHSLEVRVPLLDLEMVDWAERLAPSDRLRRLQTKSLMKRALTRLLPGEILHRPKKGFGMPVAAWLRGPLRPLMEELLSPEALERGGLFRPEGVRDLVRRHLEGRADERKALWTLLAFRLWQEAGR